ncbi:hypothetical protein CPB83DRAFT_796286 [Crepidotus variabilis]|uniref:Uncharacterized protein n=1 Tax=Crepidotus variabilis TaxID=179855 RepID=A0A9P6EAV1_9AGAR|nr:hypothetical protein CPB83DRAFT_796286 [Crepidotus variabilis]
MPVTFPVASHPANPVKDSQACKSIDNLLDWTWGTKGQGPFGGARKKKTEILQSSLSTGKEFTVDPASIRAQSNGFVHTVVNAYNQHHHLVLRPDDVWMTILSQFNFYVNAHSEDLRSSFVQHEGKKELTVTAGGDRYSVNFGTLAKEMTKEIDKNIVDKSLKDWILPNFSTTTDNDTVVCAVLMMATLKSYFDYKMCLMCGLPSVTLLGDKSDWESLIIRLDKLSSFGTEPAAFSKLLKPILRRFVDAFTRAESKAPQDTDFWGRICHYSSGGSGPSYLSGWITAFCPWDDKGKWMGPEISEGIGKGSDVVTFKSSKGPGDLGWRGLGDLPKVVLDDVPYSFIDFDDVPSGYCEVNVKLDDNGQEIDCMMVSGLMGSTVEGEKRDTLRPLPAWFMFVTETAKEPTL